MDTTLNLEQIKRALVLGFIADVPMAIVGRPGIGKSGIVYEVAEAPKVPYTMYDFNLSDKTPGDVGGIPVPRLTEKSLDFLMAKGLLPFDTDEKSILFLDEIDRAPIDTLQLAQRIIRERQVNGHKLSPNCRIVCAMNGTSDMYTNDLSESLRNRMCFLHAEAESQGALAAWLTWADEHGVSPMLQGFAKFNPNVWSTPPANARSSKPVGELAVPTPRSFTDYADKLLAAADAVNFKTDDLLDAMVAGCVGKTAALVLMEYRRVYLTCPTIEQVVQTPDTAPLVDDPGVRFAFTLALTNAAEGKREVAAAVARYGLRWADEDNAYLMQRLVEKEPTVITTPAYRTWSARSSQ